jgi:hypothetical protein
VLEDMPQLMIQFSFLQVGNVSGGVGFAMALSFIACLWCGIML